MQVCRELRPRDLQALLLDAAVWLCCDDDTVYKLDTLCFGNLDGGAGTAAYVRRHLEAAGRPVQGDKAVRLSLDEAFFMAYALGILTVHELAPSGRSAPDNGRTASGGAAPRGAGPPAAATAAAAEQQDAAAPAAAASGAPVAPDDAAAHAAAAAAATEPAPAASAAAVPAAAVPEVPAEAGLAAVQLDSGALWRRLQQLRPDFFLLYLAYHHFRSKVGGLGRVVVLCAVCRLGAAGRRAARQCRGCLDSGIPAEACPPQPGFPSILPALQGWIPRTGLQYGADFVLYQRHPALAHSDYAVTIVPLRPGQRPPMGWHDLQISNRLSTQVWDNWGLGPLRTLWLVTRWPTLLASLSSRQ